MADIPVKRILPTHKKGDTFVGCGFRIVYNGAALDLTGCQATLRLVSTVDPSVYYEMSSVAGTLSLGTPTDGIVYIVPQIINYDSAKYDYDLQLYYPATTWTKTPCYGTWKIWQDITP